ncbi:hypothetical protein [Amycolatopsis sp. NPDC059021]|uniref:GHMP family kinase ATP-binding protein n=1 Tax=Amycolatopsis sp. NPDC059021 TaxID=3346704 RepID=UPI00366D4218
MASQGLDTVHSFLSHRLGVGRAHSHHGELLQGCFGADRGRSVRALVTLPCPGRGSVAVFQPEEPGATAVTVVPSWRGKAAAAAELTGRRLTGGPVGGRLTVQSDLRPGLGLGSSTSDVTAAIRAVADSLRATLADEEVAEIAVAAEGAADSTMIARQPVLFAHREGVVLEHLPALPPLLVVGCDTAEGDGGVDTLALPPAEYSDAEAALFPVLLDGLRTACRDQDVAAVAEIADHSGRINERFLPKRGLARIRAAAGRTGGLGVQVAHSGTIAGVIFDDRDPGAGRRARDCADLLSEAGFHAVSLFRPVEREEAR